jgi:hypothetical protein
VKVGATSAFLTAISLGNSAWHAAGSPSIFVEQIIICSKEEKNQIY